MVIRAKEAALLTGEQADRMTEAKTDEEAVRILEECGYEGLAGLDAVALDKRLVSHLDGIRGEVRRFCPEPRLVDIFQLKYDYHNAKVLIKAQAASVDGARLMSGGGRFDAVVLEEAYYQDSFSAFPEAFAKAVMEARDVLSRTKDAQRADIVLDKAYFMEMTAMADSLDSDFFKGYVRLSIDSANLRTAVRAKRMNLDYDLLEEALMDGGNTIARSVAAAIRQAEPLLPLYAGSPLYAAAAAADDAISGGRLTRLEKLCDNALAGYLQAARRISFGQAPIIAYLAAVEAEAATIRIIMVSRAAGLAPDQIRERLRDSYV